MMADLGELGEHEDITMDCSCGKKQVLICDLTAHFAQDYKYGPDETNPWGFPWPYDSMYVTAAESTIWKEGSCD